MLTKAASALCRKVVEGELRAEVAVEALNALVDAIDDGIVRLTDDEVFVPSVLALALAPGDKPDAETFWRAAGSPTASRKTKASR